MITNRRHPESEIADSVAAMHTLRAAMTPPEQRYLSDLEGKLFGELDVVSSASKPSRTRGTPTRGLKLWRPERAGWIGSYRALSLLIAAAILISTLSWSALRDEEANTRADSELAAGTRVTPTFSVPTVVPPDPLAAVLWQYHLLDNAAADSFEGTIIAEGGLSNYVVISGDVLVRLHQDEQFAGIEGFNPETGVLAWTRKTDLRQNPLSQALRPARLAADDSNVYLYFVGFDEYDIQVLDPATGEDVRILNVGAPIDAIESNGFQVVVADTRKNLTAFDVQTGERLWKAGGVANLTRQLAFQPYVDADTVVAVGDNGELIAYDVENGGEKWRISTGLAAESIILQSRSGFDTPRSVLLTGSSVDREDQLDQKLISLSLVDGSTVWEAPYKASWTSDVQVGQDLVFVLLRIDRSTGQGSAFSALETFGRVLAFDLNTGTQVWQSSGYQHSFWHANRTQNGYLAAYESWERVVVYQAHNGNTACVGALPKGFVNGAVIYGKSVIYSYTDGSLVAIDIGRSCDLDVSNQVGETGGGF